MFLEIFEVFLKSFLQGLVIFDIFNHSRTFEFLWDYSDLARGGAGFQLQKIQKIIYKGG